MRRNRAALVTSVSTVMLGAGWAAGVMGAAVAPSVTLADTSGAGSAVEPAASSAASSATQAPASTGPTGTYEGALVKTREGSFQAEIVVTDGAITAVNVVVGGDDRRDSVEINERALPTLQERVLSAQTWDVQGISGASYTVQGFLTSVKDAMTQAGLA